MSVLPPKLRTLHLEIKLPRDDEHHFLQLHSSSTVGTLKSKIFRKALCLEGEKQENYVLGIKQHSKVNILTDDKIIGSHPWVEGDLKNNFFTIYVMSKQEKHETLRRKNSFTRLNMHDDTSRFLMPLPSTRFQSSKQLNGNNSNINNNSSSTTTTTDEKGKVVEEQEESKKNTSSSSKILSNAKVMRSRSEPILRPTRSLSSLSEITSDVDLLSSHSSDVDSMEEEVDDVDSSVSSHSSAHAHDDAAQLSPKVKLRERSATVDKGPVYKKSSAVPNGVISKEPGVSVGDKSTTSTTSSTTSGSGNRKKPGLWALSLFPRNNRGGEDDKDSKHRKHASMILPRTDSGNFPAEFMPTSKHRSASFEAESAPSLLARGSASGIHPVSADYSSKKSNARLVVEDDGGKLLVTGGTVEQLIWCLADRDIPDPAYCDEFFYSMTHFTNGVDLISHLSKRYEYNPPEDAPTEVIADYDKWRPVIQERVLKMMRYLLENHWYHIEKNEEILWTMKEFAESGIVKVTRVAKSLRELITSRSEGMLKRTGRTPNNTPPQPKHSNQAPLTSSSPPPTEKPAETTDNTGSTDLATHGRSSSSPIIVWRARRDTMTAENTASSNTNSPAAPQIAPIPAFEEAVPTTPTSVYVPSASYAPPPKPLGKRVKDHRKVSFIRVHPLEMARQMTLIEKELFRSIRPPELVGGAFKKKNKSEISPNVVQMIDWFNHVTAWVQKEIVLTPNLKERLTVLSLFIQVAGHLREMGNLSGAMQIVCALDTTSVKRLYRTWKGLAKKDAATFVSLQDSFTSKLNFANYRRITHESSTGAVIPYIGVVLQDLLLIDELPTMLQSTGMVNFRKMRRFSSLIRGEIIEKQAVLHKFNFEPVPAIQEYLARRTPLTEQELFRYSRLSEPSKIVT